MVVQRQAHKWGAPDLRAPLKPACGTIVTAIVTVQAAWAGWYAKRSKKREFPSLPQNYPQAALRFFVQLLLQCNIGRGETAARVRAAVTFHTRSAS